MKYQSYMFSFLIASTSFAIGYQLNISKEQEPIHEVSNETAVVKFTKVAPSASDNPFALEIAETQETTATLEEVCGTESMFKENSENDSIYTDEANLELIEIIREMPEFENSDIYQSEIESFEVEILQQLDNSPELATPLLDLYASMAEGSKKSSLRSMLAASDISVVEDRAIAEIASSDPDSQNQWLDILSSTGINKPENRDALLLQISSISDPRSIATALYALTPSVVHEYERSNIVNHLDYYLVSDNPIVKSAAIEAKGRWANKDDSRFIEDGIVDASVDVRYAAITSAYIAGIRSDQIKRSLLDVMDNEDESDVLRIKAYNALSTYPLSEDESEKLFQFTTYVNSLEYSDGATKG